MKRREQDDKTTRHGLLDRSLVDVYPGIHETTRAPMVSISLAEVAFALTADDAEAVARAILEAARLARAATSAKPTPTA